MEIERVQLIYFSPTGTTQKVLENIAQGIAAEVVEHLNFTLPEGGQQKLPSFSDELVIIGAPVYAGRLPVDAINRFKQLEGHNNLAVPVVVYGNRAFEDALLELRNLAIDLGFTPIAAGAFIGEHSFATQDIPIANGRPDYSDVQKAMDFGAKLREKISVLQFPGTLPNLEIPGSFPYKASGPRPMAVAPVSKADTCTLCGTCASVCPTVAISLNEGVMTNIKQCIRCCACIKHCPAHARVMEDSTWKSFAVWLNENCSARKEPQIFGVDG